MFEALFSSAFAFQELLKLGAGAACSGIGLAIIAFMCYLRSRDRVYEAEIVAVHQDRGEGGRAMFCPVIGYTDEQGKQHRNMANSSSSSIRGMLPGRRLKIFVDPTSPEKVMMLFDWWFVVAIGAVIFFIGIPFIQSALKTLTFDGPTMAIAALVTGYFAYKIYSKIHPLLDNRTPGGWREKLAGWKKAKGTAESGESEVLSADAIAEHFATQSKQLSRARPVLILVGVALCAGGGWWLQHRMDFIASAASAQGKVIRNELSSSGDSESTYHAVVEFVDAQNRQIIYRDSVGSSPPSFSVGEKVKIFYLPNDSRQAMIDRGFWNWLLPGGFSALGALLVFFTVKGMINDRRTETPRASAVGT
jgi:hypothetical protein